MNTAQISGTPMPTLDALGTALMGYVIVFVGIILLMIVIVVVGKIMVSSRKKKKAAAPVVTQIQETKAALPAAPGSAGKLKLYDTDPKTAAMVMAIVADKMGKPLNELRFKSIKEVK
jgi:hypothetical protein